MPYSIDWYIPDRVFIHTMWDSISLEDIQSSSKEAHKLTRIGTAPVHCIADARYLKTYPINFSMIKDAASIIREPNFGYLIHVHRDKTVSLATKILVAIANVKYESTMDIDDALQKLRHIAPDLQDLPPYPEFARPISKF